METTPPGGRAGLYVTRDAGWFGRWRKLRVLLDGVEVGRVANGETRRFDISPGPHELYVQMDWVKSEPVTFTCGEGDEIDARCGSPRPGFSIRDILFKSPWERASQPFTVEVSRRGTISTA